MTIATRLQIEYRTQPEEWTKYLMAMGDVVDRHKAALLLSHSPTPEKAIHIWDGILDSLKSRKETAARVCVGVVRCNKGNLLGALGRDTEAVACYDTIISEYGQAPELALRQCVATALNEKGLALEDLRRSTEAIACYERIIQDYSTESDPDLRSIVRQAITNKGLAQPDLGSAQEVERRLSDATALFCKALKLEKLGRNAEALSCYDRIIDDPDTELRAHIVAALQRKGHVLAKLGRFEEMFACCAKFVEEEGKLS